MGIKTKVQCTFLGNLQFRSSIYVDGDCDCNVIIFQSEPPLLKGDFKKFTIVG
jgi:hypothetical protein